MLAIVLAIGCAPGAPATRPPPPVGTPTDRYLAENSEGTPAPSPSSTGDEEAMVLHFIDVGQGAATLLEFPCGAILVDTGGEKNSQFDSEPHLLGYLDAFFARRGDLERTLDALVITHPHIDHTRSIPAVLERYRVANVIDNGDTRNDVGGAPQLYLHEWLREKNVGHVDIFAAELGERGATGPEIDPIPACPRSRVDPQIRALWGARGGREEVGHDPNDDSVVLRVDFGRSSALLSGDLEALSIAWLTKHYRAHPELLDVDIYYVPHHGSRHSTAEHFIRLVSPAIAIISMGPYERQLGTRPEYTARQFGHPNREALRDLIDPRYGVAGRREIPAEIMTGIRGAWGETPSEFEAQTVERAIYATGWDGDIQVRATAAGDLSVTTSGRERAADRDDPGAKAPPREGASGQP